MNVAQQQVVGIQTQCLKQRLFRQMEMLHRFYVRQVRAGACALDMGGD